MKYLNENRKSILLAGLLFLMCTFGKLLAQDVNLPEITPPSPTAQAFMRYGEIPVNYSTGVPNISIPIYTVKGRQLELPISISYHASGIKVNDIASEVGLGWVLNAGGMVARTVYGIPDEWRVGERPYNSASELIQAFRIGAYYVIREHYAGIDLWEDYFDSEFSDDMLSDRFFYSLPNGISGIFRYDYLNSNNIITLPYRPLKIVPHILPPSGPSEHPRIDGITITDENGIIYELQSFKTTLPQSSSEFYLTKMISADGTDSIEFNYVNQEGTFTILNNTFTLNIRTVAGNSTINHEIIQSSLPESSFNAPVLESIVSATTIVNFNYLKDREDFDRLKRLNSITIAPANLPSKILRNVQFTPKYFGNTAESKRMGLDKITISTPSDPKPQQYTFNYEALQLPAYPNKMETNRTYSEDYWGYYNNGLSSNLIPSDFVPDGVLGNFGNRNPNVAFGRACMLNEIKYPTGGRTVFEFQRNYSNGYVGGYRVGSITSKNENGEIVGVKTYEYSSARSREISEMLLWIYHNSISTLQYALITDHNLLSDPVLPLEVASGLPIMYQTVIEYHGTKTENNGKTVYNYNPPYSASNYESNPEGLPYYDDPSKYMACHYDKGNYVPELISKADYSFDGTNYHIVSKQENIYTKQFARNFQTGIKITRTFTPLEEPGVREMEAFMDAYINSVFAVDTKAYQEASLLTNSENFTYDLLDSTKYTITSTDYAYNENNINIKEQKTVSSEGHTLKTTYKYPVDFSNVPYNAMVRRNIISPVIEQIETNNLNHVKSVKNNYSTWEAQVFGNVEVEIDNQTSASSSFTISESQQLSIGYYLQMFHGHFKLSISGPVSYTKFYYGDGNGFYTSEGNELFDLLPGSYSITLLFIQGDGYSNESFFGRVSYGGTINSSSTAKIYPSSVDVKLGDNNYKNKLNYHNYDNYGNILSASKVNDNKISYYYAYNNTYPIIKAENCTYTALNTAVGNLSLAFNGSPVATLDEFLALLNDLDHQFEYSALATMVSELKAQLPNALLTIYTYIPLVGMNSMTDLNGKTTYYMYDSFGRLYQVLDHNRNVLKQNTYHYANQ